MKKGYAILIIILIANTYLFAQNEACKTVISGGITLFNSGKYTEAKEKFEAAKRINCDNAQLWIDKCNAKLNTPKPPVNIDKTPKQILCEQRFKDGKEYYDKADYNTALWFFQKGVSEGCNNIDFENYIDMCNIKINEVAETVTKEERVSVCIQTYNDGYEAFQAGNYALAKMYFSQGVNGNCNEYLTEYKNALEQCEKQLAYQNATLSVSPTTIEFEALGGSKTIYITTNYSEWSCSNVMNWLSVNKYPSYITLTCNANTSISERTDYFDIIAGSKSVRVNIKQKGDTEPSATIKKIWAEHNVYENNVKGMKIHIEFDVKNMLNKTGQVVAWFYYQNGNKLLDANSSYRTTDGQVSNSRTYTPSYQNATYSDLSFFMPYSELHCPSSDKTDLKFCCGVFDNNNRQMAISEFNSFWYGTAN